ncbi:GntR family transcriptional regulator [Bacillus daqingensis]|uniref:GntR family transcriptional regulator n=1 Tax=Bacillus daqingensis TaxID=872396 RepID=A0ABV9NZ84_9BACI
MPTDHTSAKNGPVFQQIWNLIITGEIKSGQLLTERTLAESLGVSRTPIRESLRKLEKYGLVRHEPHKGVRVVSVDRESVRQLYEVRELLEGLAAATLAKKIQDIDISSMETLLYKAEKAAEENDIKRLSQINAGFHYELAKKSGNMYLEDIMSTLQSHISLVMSKSLSLTGRPQENIAEHWMILQAIKQGDPSLAESITKYHVRKAMEKALKKIDAAEREET